MQPLFYADRRETLLAYRDAEVKHARLAMLAAAGWPLAELFHPKLAAALGLVVSATKQRKSLEATCLFWP